MTTNPQKYGVGGWWRWALVSPDGVAPSRMVGVSACSLLALAHPGGPGKRAVKQVWCGGIVNDDFVAYLLVNLSVKEC